jgi:predicted MFS family arabinose efflux permease
LISVSGWALETLAIHRRPFLNSVVFAGVGCGIAMAGLLCIGLMQAGLGSAYAWAALGLLAAAVTAIVWRAFRPQVPHATAAAFGERQRYQWNAASTRAVAAYGIFGFGYIIPATFLPVMAKEALHGSPLFAWSWPVFGTAAVLSTLMVAPLVRLAGNRRLWIAGHLVMAAGVVMPAMWPHLASILIAALCVGGTFMVITVAALQEAKHIAGKDSTTLIAAMTSAFAAGQIAGPLTVSAGGGNGFGIALIFAAFLLIIGALLLVRKSGQASQQPST